MRVLSVVIVALAALQPPSPPDEAQIRALFETTMPARYHAADAHGIAPLGADDATHAGLVRGATLRSGPADIARMWNGRFSQPNRERDRRLTAIVTSICFVRAAVAAVGVQITYRGGRASDGAPKPDTGEPLFAVASRENSAWMMAASRIVPLSPEPAR